MAEIKVNDADGNPQFMSMASGDGMTGTGYVPYHTITGTVPLPTGAATAAKQPALGTAGSASSDVITVQGVTSMAPLVIADGSGSITVDNGGTFAVQAAQSGTWNVTNISGTVSLPTGAATAAKQPALGTAGTASSDVITVQGISSMTALKVDGSAVTQPVSYATTGSGTATGALRVELPTNGTGVIATVGAVTAITNALPAGSNAIGKLAANSGVDIGDVDVTSVPADPFGANADAASATGSISAKLRFIASTGIPITGTVTVGSHAVTNAGTFAVQAACTNAGTFATQVDGAALTALQLIDNITPAIVGPETAGKPTIDSYTSKAISASANTANQQLVAAPGASKQIWVYGFVGSADTGDGSISLQDEDDTAGSGVMPVVQNGGFAVAPSGNFAMPWLKVATNKALEIDTVTCGFKGVLSYAVVSV